MTQQPNSQQLLTDDVLSQVGNLDFIAQQVVDGHLSGKHRSPYFGGTIEFAEHRNYTPGDEIRLIDWRALARTDRYYIKQYERDTNLRATLVLDATASMAFAMSTISKLRYAQILTACMARLLLAQRDQVALTISNSSNANNIPPRATASHLKVITDTLDKLQPAGDTQLPDTLNTVATQARQRSLTIIFSDCFANLENLLTSISKLRSRHHEIVLFHILAPEEIDFPFSRWSRFENIEAPSQSLNTDPISIRKQYLQNINQFLQQLETGCHERGCDYVQAITDQPVEHTLANYLISRTNRN